MIVESAFEEIIEAHRDSVWRVCRSLLPVAAAEDAWSETFLSALEAYPKLRADSNVRGWLVTIAYRKAIDEIRGMNRRPLLVKAVPDSPMNDRARLDSDELRQALAALTDRQRRAVVYRHLGDLAYSDIAALLECTPDAARRVVADGIANLRKDLKKGKTP